MSSQDADHKLQLYNIMIVQGYIVRTILTAREGIADLKRLRFHFPHVFFRLLSSSPLRRLETNCKMNEM